MPEVRTWYSLNMAESRVGLVGLAVGGGALALALIVAVVVVVRLMSADESHASANVGSGGEGVGNDGLRARGTEELRRLGCNPAVVIDMSRLLGDGASLRKGEPRLVVTCDVADGGEPRCDQVAGTYFAALGGSAAGNVNVRVMRTGSSRPVCSHLYAPSGADIGESPNH
jgi:hypothetical protein